MIVEYLIFKAFDNLQEQSTQNISNNGVHLQNLAKKDLCSNCNSHDGAPSEIVNSPRLVEQTFKLIVCLKNKDLQLLCHSTCKVGDLFASIADNCLYSPEKMHAICYMEGFSERVSSYNFKYFRYKS